MAKKVTQLNITAMTNEEVAELLHAKVEQTLEEVDGSMWSNIWSSIASLFGIINIGSKWGQESIAYHKELSNISRSEDLYKQLDKIRKRSKK